MCRHSACIAGRVQQLLDSLEEIRSVRPSALGPASESRSIRTLSRRPSSTAGSESGPGPQSLALLHARGLLTEGGTAACLAQRHGHLGRRAGLQDGHVLTEQ